MKHKIGVIPGDGIGPEVMDVAIRVLRTLCDVHRIALHLDTGLIGGAAIDDCVRPLTDETIAMCRNADFTLLGAVGGPKWDNVTYDRRPEAGLLKLRKDLDLFANLRPAIVFDALIDASTLKPDIIRGLDIMIVRELTGGVYFGEPRGIEDLPNGEKRGFNTQTYTTSEIERIGRVAFDLAHLRRGHVTSCEKANVMESGVLWRQVMTALHNRDYADTKLDHMYADNCAMQLLKNPAQFDVIVTDNLFGDILSDEAAMLTGSLGMLPSASLGSETGNGKRAAVYEPVHGSAPDIAGKDIANPLAMVLSLAMALRYSIKRGDLADQVENAVKKTLDNGYRTRDLAGQNDTTHITYVSTSEMGDLVIQNLSI